MIQKQKFGVEIEMTGITRQKAANLIGSILGSSPSSLSNGVYKTITIEDNKGRSWKVMRDSSIAPIINDNTDENIDEYKVEFVTPPLNYNDIDLLQNIVRHLRENGAKTNNSCGIHIHIDGANHNALSVKRLVNFMTSRQDLIYEALEIGSRADHWCHKLNRKLLDDMKMDRNLTKNSLERIWYSSSNDNYNGGIDHAHYNSTRYHGVNLHSYFSKGTIEFRLFNSTLHAGKVKAYVQFCLAISAWSITSEDKILFRTTNNYTASQKVTLMRNILTNRLGLYGEEYKTCRLLLLRPLKKIAESFSEAS